MSAELANLNIKGPFETCSLHCHQTLICAFLPGSDGNISHRLNLSLSLSCLDISPELGQSEECWQGACHCWHFSKPHLDWRRSTNSHWNFKGNFIKSKDLFSDCMVATFWTGRLQTQTHTQLSLPFIISASCLMPILPKQRGRLCTWIVDKGEVFGVSYCLC